MESIMPGDSSMGGFCFYGFTVWTHENTGHHSQRAITYNITRKNSRKNLKYQFKTIRKLGKISQNVRLSLEYKMFFPITIQIINSVISKALNSENKYILRLIQGIFGIVTSILTPTNWVEKISLKE